MTSLAMKILSKRLRLASSLLIVGATTYLFYWCMAWFNSTGRLSLRSVYLHTSDVASMVHGMEFNNHHVKALELQEEPTGEDQVRIEYSLNYTHSLETPTEMQFHVRSSFQLPVPHSTLSVKVLLKQDWMKELKHILSAIDPHSGPITLTTSDYNFRDILLNWIIASTLQVSPRLSNLLVLCMDRSVYNLLRGRGISCIYADPKTFVSDRVSHHLKKHIAFTQTQILRLTIMRFLNHWGYDAASYDVDAIPIKNPESLYYDVHRGSDLIASYGHYPAVIKAQWGGATLCAGAFMIKSSSSIELFWEAMNVVLPNSYNDQARLNNALFKMSVQWNESRHGNILTSDWQGSTTAGLNVTILSALRICRQTCHRTHRSEYFVWHKGGSGREGKRNRALQGGVWFLRDNWETITDSNSSLKGIDWLRAISV